MNVTEFVYDGIMKRFLHSIFNGRFHECALANNESIRIPANDAIEIILHVCANWESA